MSLKCKTHDLLVKTCQFVEKHRTRSPCSALQWLLSPSLQKERSYCGVAADPPSFFSAVFLCMVDFFLYNAQYPLRRTRTIQKTTCEFNSMAFGFSYSFPIQFYKPIWYPIHVDLCASRAAVFPSFFGQSERSLCVIYYIKFNKQFQPFAILYKRRIINSKAAFYSGLSCPFVKSTGNECYDYKIGISVTNY